MFVCMWKPLSQMFVVCGLLFHSCKVCEVYLEIHLEDWTAAMKSHAESCFPCSFELRSVRCDVIWCQPQRSWYQFFTHLLKICPLRGLVLCHESLYSVSNSLEVWQHLAFAQQLHLSVPQPAVCSCRLVLSDRQIKRAPSACGGVPVCRKFCIYGETVPNPG